MFLVLKSEDIRVIGPIFGSPRAIFQVRPGVGHIEPKLGVWGKKKLTFQKSIQEPTLRVGESRKPFFTVICAVFELNLHVF